MCKNRNDHTSFWRCRQKVKDKVRVNVVIRNHLRCICLFSQTDVMSGSSFSLSVSGPVSFVGCLVFRRWAQTQTVPCIRFQTPLFHLLSLWMFVLALSSRMDGNSNSWELSASLRSAAFVVCHWGGWFSSWSCVSGGLRRWGERGTIRDVKSTPQHKLFPKLTNDSAMHTHITSHTHKSQFEAKWSVIKGLCVLLPYNGGLTCRWVQWTPASTRFDKDCQSQQALSFTP